MSDKEKAKKLINQFIENGLLDKKMGIISAKQCAKIAIDFSINKFIDLSNGEFTYINEVLKLENIKIEVDNYND